MRFPAEDVATVPVAVQPRIWVNGEPQPGDGLHLSARDRGFTLGDGVFETMHVRRGVAFRFEQHRARLSHALGVMEIPEPAMLEAWMQAAARAAGQDGAVGATSTSATSIGAADASLRVTVSRGVGSVGVPPPVDARPTVVAVLGPMPHVAPAVYEQGLSAHIARGRRNGWAMTAGLKTTAYADSVLAWIEARRAGANEALFLDTEAHCSEATSSNLFVYANGQLLTPPTSCGALPGITRATVIELGAELGLPVAEQAFGLETLLAADEAFLTSSLRGLAPLVRVGDARIGAGAPGSTTRRLMDAYAALVDRECRA